MLHVHATYTYTYTDLHTFTVVQSQIALIDTRLRSVARLCVTTNGRDIQADLCSSGHVHGGAVEAHVGAEWADGSRVGLKACTIYWSNTQRRLEQERIPAINVCW